MKNIILKSLISCVMTLCTLGAYADETPDYLCFTALTDNCTIKVLSETYDRAGLVFSYNGKDWWYGYMTQDINRWVIQSSTLKAGEKLYIKNEGTVTSFSKKKIMITSGSVAASGNIMSLVDGTCETTVMTPEMSFEDLFWYSVGLVDASELKLSATTLSESCYKDMFIECTNLVAPPKLPATTLANGCYDEMFRECRSLIEAPELPATTLAPYCYYNMFNNCTSLTKTPELPAMNLAENCYDYMFNGCLNLTETSALPATTLAPYCYNNMFNNCTSLKVAPKLPALNLADYCYRCMFSGCTSLIKVPELPAMNLANGCYTFMFGNCTSLILPPKLPANNLVQSCYLAMFTGCTGLKVAPEIAATSLVENSMERMFTDCSKLTYIKVNFSDWNVQKVGEENYSEFGEIPHSTVAWVSGVAPHGIFVCPGNLKIYKPRIECSYDPIDWYIVNNDYLCFVAESDNVAVALNKINQPSDVAIEYSTTGEAGTWYPVAFNNPISLEHIGDVIFFRNANEGIKNFSKDADNYYQFAITGTVAAYGNIMALVDNTCQTTAIPNDYCFYGLFSGCKDLSNAPELPAVNLTENCYAKMFEGCSGLVAAPTLPAKVLVSGCYEEMFKDCSQLSFIDVGFSAWNPEDATENWVSGVSQTGYFICSDVLTHTFDASHIPLNDTYRWILLKSRPSMKTFNLDVTSAGWASMYYDATLSIPEGVKVYYANAAEGNKLVLQRIYRKIAPCTAVVVNAAKGIVQFPVLDEEMEPIEDNILEGKLENESCDVQTNYVLDITRSTPKKGVFSIYNNTTLHQYKAYLPMDKVPVKSNEIKFFADAFDEEADAIENVGMGNRKGAIYNLMGTRVGDDYHGIIIKDGKKMLNY
ncbi:MAG: leucine-rich repeat protein [Bacteroidaceae bacterium]|nr:leucine-rich repeat protein [Bacteroidaceae bacterium]